ncbi:hypothetical protein OJ996_25970 [Luteolibacter sp. GHJ8]|uniref:Uncharacterized protein n=1 Tax=Luteolibacter rhizosphaerae TaxID=2989719 RepID=A0ABT3GB39_9BACT|nr:hypothetical protein [Luteolibacter rhizosphaerae]MCW1917063.1 hypothetical protein [Luteolibacter rhizosphaerae]
MPVRRAGKARATDDTARARGGQHGGPNGKPHAELLGPIRECGEFAHHCRALLRQGSEGIEDPSAGDLDCHRLEGVAEFEHRSRKALRAGLRELLGGHLVVRGVHILLQSSCTFDREDGGGANGIAAEDRLQRGGLLRCTEPAQLGLELFGEFAQALE